MPRKSVKSTKTARDDNFHIGEYVFFPAYDGGRRIPNGWRLAKIAEISEPNQVYALQYLDGGWQSYAEIADIRSLDCTQYVIFDDKED